MEQLILETISRHIKDEESAWPRKPRASSAEVESHNPTLLPPLEFRVQFWFLLYKKAVARLERFQRRTQR